MHGGYIIRKFLVDRLSLEFRPAFTIKNQGVPILIRHIPLQGFAYQVGAGGKTMDLTQCHIIRDWGHTAVGTRV